MKRRVLVAAALLVVAAAGLAFMKYGRVHKQDCSGISVYRTNFGLYHCEFNSEAHPDWQCRNKVAGIEGYFLLRDLTPQECAAATKS